MHLPILCLTSDSHRGSRGFEVEVNDAFRNGDGVERARTMLGQETRERKPRNKPPASARPRIVHANACHLQ